MVKKFQPRDYWRWNCDPPNFLSCKFTFSNEASTIPLAMTCGKLFGKISEPKKVSFYLESINNEDKLQRRNLGIVLYPSHGTLCELLWRLKITFSCAVTLLLLLSILFSSVRWTNPSNI